MSSPSTPSTRPHRRERGNVGLGYLALILIAALVCGAVVTAVPLAKVSAQMRCAVESILTLRWTFDCGADDAAGGGSGGDAGNGGDAGATPTSPDGGSVPLSCSDPVYGQFDAVPTQILGQSKRVDTLPKDPHPTMVRFDCVWYYIPPDCGAPPAGWAAGLTPGQGVDVTAFRTCVTSGRDAATPTQSDNPACVNAMPDGLASGEAATARVQIGCTNYVVPQQCRAEWNEYVSADEAAQHVEGAGPTVSAGITLATCILTTYNSLEPDCAVWANSSTSTKTKQILFWKWNKSNGMVVEKLGDGRVRLTLARGSSKGSGIDFLLSAGSASVSAGLWGMTGVENTDAFEFANETDAQAWLDWFQQYDAADTAMANFDNDH
ncbi:MAG TPA: hypothetical protein PLK46_11215, partial [Propioniciclava sp.]